MQAVFNQARGMIRIKSPPMLQPMQTRHLARYACAIALGITAIAAEAKEVTFQHKGLTLNANLGLAVDKTLADGVILITYGGLAHRGNYSGEITESGLAR